MLDDQLRTILGDTLDDPAPAELADAFEGAVTGLPLAGGRWRRRGRRARCPTPRICGSGDMWRCFREMARRQPHRHADHARPDGLDVVTFHEADLPDPTVSRRIMGREAIVHPRLVR